MSTSDIELFKQKFNSIYFNTVRDILSSFEKERKKRLCKFLLFLLIYALSAYYFINNVIHNDVHLFFNVAMACITIISLPFFVCIYIKLFAENIKEKCLPKILSTLGSLKREGFVDNFFSDEELKSSNLFSNFNIVTYDDCYSGIYKDISFKFAETNLTYKQVYGRMTDYLCFNGIILTFQANKKFIHPTIIAPKKDEDIQNRYNTKFAIKFILIGIFSILCTVLTILFITILQPLGKYIDINTILLTHTPSLYLLPIIPLGVILYLIYFYIKRKDSLKEKIISEDIVFNNLYSVYSEDQTEGRYIITPSFIERFLNLKTAFKTKQMKCSFYGNKIMFAIPTLRDCFEIGSLFRPLTDTKSIEKFFNEIISIYLIIDNFKLDEKTGL